MNINKVGILCFNEFTLKHRLLWLNGTAQCYYKVKCVGPYGDTLNAIFYSEVEMPRL